MSEPSYEEVEIDILLNKLYHNLERIQHLKRKANELSERIRRDQEALRDYEAQSEALTEVVRYTILNFDRPIDEEPFDEEEM